MGIWDKLGSGTNDEKSRQLNEGAESSDGEFLTTNQGVKVSDTDNSLKAGERGPTLIEDFHFREKMTHFDHERIPERVVHARGSAAHGYFQPYKSWASLTRARFLSDPSVKTPVFVRFSTVVGFRGSADTVRDVRGFATKFYTEEGNYDLVGNNMPVFFIQDGIKFPDLVHSIKPEPHHEMPQAAAAHDNFWDFISLTPESTHMIMWVLSDWALPRSYSQMDGFGVHTFRFINERGEASFVKLHWRPANGAYSLVFDEAQKLAGQDADFNRRDLWESIEKGNYPEYELCAQVVEEKDEFKFDFDLLDPTKIIPEEDVPLLRLGKMVLNRNPDNFFAETEQVAFHPGHVVPGIDVTNDPLLQARLFSYLDTQLIRLGGPNFTEIPINRPVIDVHNNQRDGYSRQTINKGPVNYSPNTRARGCPMAAGFKQGGYVHHQERVEGHKIRARSPSFSDHFSQATLFWNSLTPVERDHLVEAAHFELGKVESKEIRKRVVDAIFNPVDHELARRVAMGLGVEAPERPVAENHGRASRFISLETRKTGSIKGRKVAVLALDGADGDQIRRMKEILSSEGAEALVISKFAHPIAGADGGSIEVDKIFSTVGPVMFDAVFVPGGDAHVSSLEEGDYVSEFLMQMHKHFKPIAASGEAVRLLQGMGIDDQILASPGKPEIVSVHGIVTTTAGAPQGESASFEQQFARAIAEHRHWGREPLSPLKRKPAAPEKGALDAHPAPH